MNGFSSFFARLRFCQLPFLAVFLCAFFLFVSEKSFASGISASAIKIALEDDHFTLSTDFDIALNPRLEEAINRGIALTFRLDFELSQARWYWLDQKIVQKERVYQLSYHALTRQYRLSIGGLHQNFARLEAALKTLARLRNWSVVNKNELTNNSLQGALRLRLDLTQLPKTFQVDALVSGREWNLSSDWLRFNFEAPDNLNHAETAQMLNIPNTPNTPNTNAENEK